MWVTVVRGGWLPTRCQVFSGPRLAVAGSGKKRRSCEPELQVYRVCKAAHREITCGIERQMKKRAEQTADDPADRLARYKLYDQYYRDSTRWIVTSRFKQLTPPNLPRVNQLPAVYSSGAGVATPSMPPECGKGSTRGRHGGARGAPSSAAVDASVVGGSAVFGAVLVAPEDARWVGRLAHLAAHARHHLGRRVVMVEVAHAPATPATG